MVARRTLRSFKRYGPAAVLMLALTFGGISLWQAWDIATHLRRQARDTSRIYGQIIAALSDPGHETPTLFELVKDVRATGIPIVLTDSTGRPTAWVNTPFDSAGVALSIEDDSSIRAYVDELDRFSPPLKVPGLEVHAGSLPVARRLTWLGLLQLAILATAVAVGVWAYRTSVDRHRGQLWVAMARESAHQLGTPLMSADAWVERLADLPDERAQNIAEHLTADLERLQRVAKRFERIGRPARRDRVALGAVAERVASYFEPRLPRHANPVNLVVRAPDAGPMIHADPVLVEWALEALVRNSIDALSGRGGNISIDVRTAGTQARLTVTDDGPGIPIEVRSNLFEPGVSTKSGGWGIGLALARRIFEEVHGGRLDLAQSEVGATFIARLPIAGEVGVGD